MGNASSCAASYAVVSRRLYGPESLHTPHFGLFRSDNGQCVGNAYKASYVPHTVDDVVVLAEAAGEAFDGSANVQCTFRKC